jgi:hypothetical protein
VSRRRNRGTRGCVEQKGVVVAAQMIWHRTMVLIRHRTMPSSGKGPRRAIRRRAKPKPGTLNRGTTQMTQILTGPASLRRRLGAGTISPGRHEGPLHIQTTTTATTAVRAQGPRGRRPAAPRPDPGSHGRRGRRAPPGATRA